MSLISKKKGERIDKFLGENLDDLSVLIFRNF